MLLQTYKKLLCNCTMCTPIYISAHYTLAKGKLARKCVIINSKWKKFYRYTTLTFMMHICNTYCCYAFRAEIYLLLSNTLVVTYIQKNSLRFPVFLGKCFM